MKHSQLQYMYLLPGTLTDILKVMVKVIQIFQPRHTPFCYDGNNTKNVNLNNYCILVLKFKDPEVISTSVITGQF